MRKPLAHPAHKSRSGQPEPPPGGAKPKHRTPAPSSTTDLPADSATPPGGLLGATERAINDIEAETERLADSEETLPELEREIGIADWIDPQTGEPAEGQSPPHIDDE